MESRLPFFGQAFPPNGLRGRLPRSMSRGNTAGQWPVSGNAGSRLRELRRSAGHTAKDCAARLGVDPSAISRIERGCQTISMELLHRYCGLLGVAPGAVLAHEQPPRQMVLPYETTQPLTEHELIQLALLWGRVSRSDIEIVYPEGEELLAEIDFPRLMSSMGRLLDEVGRLRGVVAALSAADGAREAPPAKPTQGGKMFTRGSDTGGRGSGLGK